VDLRVAVDLAGGGLEEARARALGERQEVVGAHHAGEHGVLRVGLVVGGRGRAGEVEDPVELDPPAQARRQGVDDVRVDQVEPGLALQVAQVLAAAGEEVVQADHVGAVGEQGVAEVGAQEPGPAGHENDAALAMSHGLIPPNACRTRAATNRRAST
jgi:hypothetical protein